ncbi:MAG: hypothetical protein EP330_07640 [Deltaproteobacteria bacterium]|nr:MAG: hypothetical protein EP330_07640 [Deltaproteobacteria bacterium]
MDDFERADSSNPGSPQVGPGAWFEHTSSNARIVDGTLRTGDGGILYLSIDQGTTYALDGLRLRVELIRNHDGGVVLLGVNGDAANSAPAYHPGVALGGSTSPVLYFYDGNQNDGTSPTIPGFDNATTHYLELTLSGNQATSTIATGNYATAGGTVLQTLGPLATSTVSTRHIRLSMDDNFRGGSLAVEAVSVASCP